MARTIEAGGLRAELVRTRRRSVSLQLLPDLGLLLRAPLTASDDFLEDFLLRRKDWVQTHRARLEALRAADPGPIWSAGGEVPFLGRKLALDVRVGSRSAARLRPEGLVAVVPDVGDALAVRAAVERLYAREAAKRFPSLLDACLERAAPRRLPRPDLRLRAMRSRWGSCDPVKKVVTLNVRLLRFSPEVIEYVIMHELAHLRHRGHDERFYGLLEELCPQWKSMRRLLAGVFLD
jgi:predicted metal-dependent hydrolase